MNAVLAMIAKEPPDVVLRAMRSVAHLVEKIVLVVAPGDPLREITLPKPGRIYELPWEGHAPTRTQAYHLASCHAGPHGWVLMIDPRDVAMAGAEAPWMSLPETLAGAHDVYETPIDMRFDGGRWRWYRRGHIMRAGLELRWSGPAGLHETLDLPDSCFGRWDGLTLRPQPKPPEQKRDYLVDALRIKQSIAEAVAAGKDEDPRATFYLAQSYKDAMQHERAFAVFEHRAKMQGDREETFWAFLWMAKLGPFCFPDDHPQIVRRMRDAIAFAPDRAEGHHLLAGYLHWRTEHGHPDDADESRREFAAANACAYPMKARYFVDVQSYSTAALNKAGIPLL